VQIALDSFCFPLASRSQNVEKGQPARVARLQRRDPRMNVSGTTDLDWLIRRSLDGVNEPSFLWQS
jgi:hypothetical protein